MQLEWRQALVSDAADAAAAAAQLPQAVQSMSGELLLRVEVGAVGSEGGGLCGCAQEEGQDEAVRGEGVLVLLLQMLQEFRSNGSGGSCSSQINGFMRGR